MSTKPIKEVFDSGECPQCNAEIITDETMTRYFCSENKDHFFLEVEFHGGDKMTATLNGVDVPQEELNKLEW